MRSLRKRVKTKLFKSYLLPTQQHMRGGGAEAAKIND